MVNFINDHNHEKQRDGYAEKTNQVPPDNDETGHSGLEPKVSLLRSEFLKESAPNASYWKIGLAFIILILPLFLLSFMIWETVPEMETILYEKNEK